MMIDSIKKVLKSSSIGSYIREKSMKFINNSPELQHLQTLSPS